MSEPARLGAGPGRQTGESSMQITIPNVPDKVTYAVATAAGIAIVNMLLAVAAGLVGGGVIALAIAGATYWFVYRNLAPSPATARLATAVLAIIHAFLALVSISFHLVLLFLLHVVAAGCLGYAYMQLNQTADTFDRGL